MLNLAYSYSYMTVCIVVKREKIEKVTLTLIMPNLAKLANFIKLE